MADFLDFADTVEGLYSSIDSRRDYWFRSFKLDRETLTKTFAGGECNIELAAEFISNDVYPYDDTSTPEVESGKMTIRVSDRPKYVGQLFYQGRAELPRIERKLPPLLTTQLSFSELELSLNNCDGAYNKFLIGGVYYTPFVGSEVSLYVGLRDVSPTYFPVFRGTVHSEGGMERSRDKITLRAREFFEYFNTKIPFPKITKEEFLTAPDDVIGKLIPVCLGDWSYGITFDDSAVTTSVDTGGAEQVQVRTKTTQAIEGGAKGFYVGGNYFLIGIGSLGGNSINFQTIEDCLIKRGDYYLKTSFRSTAEVTGNGYWAVWVNGLIRDSDGATVPYFYSSGDVAIIKVKSSFQKTSAFEPEDANPVHMTRVFLYACALALNLDFAWDDNESTTKPRFSHNWNIIANKGNPSIVLANGKLPAIPATPNTPAASNMYDGVKMRIWLGDENINVFEYAIGLLRQVRCDLFVNKNRQIDLITQHWEDVPTLESMRHIEQVHVLEDTMNPQLDRRNTFTAANATYAYAPALDGASKKTRKFYNSTAQDKLKETAKTIELPNLYIEANATDQLKEMIRLYSALTEEIVLSVAWVHLDVELGEWITLSFNVGSIKFEQVVCQVRSISIDPSGGSLELRLLSFGNFKLPNYTPENVGRNLSGYDMLISEE